MCNKQSLSYHSLSHYLLSQSWHGGRREATNNIQDVLRLHYCHVQASKMKTTKVLQKNQVPIAHTDPAFPADQL